MSLKSRILCVTRTDVFTLAVDLNDQHSSEFDKKLGSDSLGISYN